MSAEIVRAACPHDCPDTCGMLVTVEDGVATKIQGDPSMPFTDGTLCTKVAYYLERTYSPDRLLYPMRRVAPKGKGQFERITWDAALDEIAARLKGLAAEDPQTILPCSYAGTMGMVQYSSMDRRFFHKLGASLLDRTLCSSAGKYGLKATLGASVGMDPERFEEAKLIILWGANPIVSNLHLWGRVQAAKRRGAKVIAIDPYRSLSAEKCTQHIALLPGTDGALALGMMHVLMREGLIDRDYVSRYTLGYEALEKRALAEYPPERVAKLCGLTADEVVKLARDYGTIKPSAIRLNYGMQRHAGGGIAARTIACLPAPVGEALPNSEIFRRLAARMGFDEPCFRDSDEDICRSALAGKADWEALKRDGWQRLAVPQRFAPFAQGGFPTPSGKCEFHSAWLQQQGVDPLPFYNPPVEVADAALAERYPLAFISPPARHFLNSSFANLPRF